jgi:acyl carrier protein
MSLDDIYQQLSGILRDVFDDDSLVARPDLTASQVDGWDSLSHLRLMFSVERSFGVDIAASEIFSLKNVGELASLIQSKLSGERAFSPSEES